MRVDCWYCVMVRSPMTFNNANPISRSRYLLAILIACYVFAGVAEAEKWQSGGNLKYFLSVTQYDNDNLFAQLDQSTPLDQSLSVRLTAQKKWSSSWDVVVHYQATALYSDSVEVLRNTGLPPSYLVYGLPNDDTRLFDLTAIAKGDSLDDGKSVIYHRLDRLAVGYTESNYVFRFGRQAISWGNGLVFQPMDIFNPFSPTAIDKEYKTGDDMLYFQYLLASGDDVQSVLIPRRDVNSGNLRADESSLALKYHATRGATDFDLLAARHYADNLMGIGFASDWQGAVLRGDVVNVWNPGGPTWSGVASINYSWMWSHYNVSGFLEYYHNGYGISNEDYSPTVLINKPELLTRLLRGEIFTLAKDYLAASLNVEFTPRWLFNPLLIYNINDSSWLSQWLATFDWQQNLTLRLGATIPLGSHGTEFGGIPTDLAGVYSGGGQSVYAQLAYYF